MCDFHCGIPVYYGGFIFTGYRIFLSNGNMLSYHVYHGVHAGLCNISWSCEVNHDIFIPLQSISC